MQGHRYRKSRIPKDSRTIPIYGDPIKGDGNNDGKYYKCWNCGFVCDVDRDALGDGQSRDGVAINEFIEIAYGGLPSSFAVLGGKLAVLEKGLDEAGQEGRKGLHVGLVVSKCNMYYITCPITSA